MISSFVIVGHRGWPARFPDNSLAGFIAASEVAQMVEVDVRRCGDGRLVLSHDPVLGDYRVAETPWSVLGELDLGGGHHPALLDEVMAALPSTPIQLEVKNWPTEPGFEPDHRLALETAERARRVDIVTGFNPETMKEVRRVFPDVATGQAIQEPVVFNEAVKHCLDVGHRALVPNHYQITEELNGELEVYPWTVNDPNRARKLLDFGVTGIISDDPGLMNETLRSD